MELTKEAIEKRIQELQKAKEQMIGQINAINGALQELTMLITVKSEVKEGVKNE